MAQEQMPHKLMLNERRDLTVTGVTEVVSFDDALVVLLTELGKLTVHGGSLQLKQLEGGQVKVEGTVTALVYEENGPGRNFWERLFG